MIQMQFNEKNKNENKNKPYWYDDLRDFIWLLVGVIMILLVTAK